MHYLCSMDRRKYLAHLALIAAGLLFGANYWIAKSLMPDYLEPVTIIIFRTSGALFLFALILPFASAARFSRKEWILMALCGLSGVTINQYLFFEGLNLSTPVETSLLHTISPIVVMLLASLLIGEKTGAVQIAGVVLGFAGAVMLSLWGKSLSWDDSHLKGNLLIIANITSYSIYLVIAKPLMQRHHPIRVTFWIFFFGWIFFMPLALPNLPTAETLQLPTQVWLSLIYVVAGTTFLTYLLTMTGLRTLPAGTVGYYIYLQPLISGSIGVISGLEPLTLTAIGSAVLIFSGVFLVNWPSLRKASGGMKQTIKRRF